MSRYWAIVAWLFALVALHSGLTRGWTLGHAIIGLFCACVAFEYWAVKHPRWVYGDYRKIEPPTE
jgi:hypothetical protein